MMITGTTYPESAVLDTSVPPETFAGEMQDRPATNGELSWPGVVVDGRLRTGTTIKRNRGKSRGTRGVPQAWGAWTVPKGQTWVGRRARMIWVQVYDAIEARNGCPPNVSQLAVLSSIIDYQIYADLSKRMGCRKFNDLTFTPRDLKDTYGAAATATSLRAKLILSLGIDANDLDLFGAALSDDSPPEPRDAGIVIDAPKDDDEDRGAV